MPGECRLDCFAARVPIACSAMTERIGFLLLPQFALIPFSAAIEPLRLVNRQTGKKLYEWQLLTVDGAPVTTTTGIEIRPHTCLSAAARLDLLIVAASTGVESFEHKQTFRHLGRLANTGCALGAVTLGSFILARAGLLDGYRCTVHWESLAAFREEFPHLDVRKEVFEIDRNRLTCSGGTAALDMMLSYIAARQGWQLAKDVAELFLHERIRSSSEPQRMPLNIRLGVSHPKLIRVIELMEHSTDEILSPRELADRVGLSGRQVERLFRKYLGTSPKRYYLENRLSRAQQLLRQTTLSILDVSVACGFSTPSHFTKSYRERYALTPRDERARGYGV